ncbi:MAG: hypothetical protein H0V93_12735 [Euzebyales bacterium]|nr:hypothetical protein [Euzebyales bacterium]
MRSLPSLLLVLLVAACGQAAEPTADQPIAVEPTATAADPAPTGQTHPDVVDAELTDEGASWSLAVTLSSPYDTADRYADGWRVLTPDGTVLGEHELTHDHAAEQPFTRVQRGLRIPEGVDEITVEGRDLVNGYGGTTMVVTVPR